jgi:hypothetical protein
LDAKIIYVRKGIFLAYEPFFGKLKGELKKEAKKPSQKTGGLIASKRFN